MSKYPKKSNERSYAKAQCRTMNIRYTSLIESNRSGDRYDCSYVEINNNKSVVGKPKKFMFNNLFNPKTIVKEHTEQLRLTAAKSLTVTIKETSSYSVCTQWRFTNESDHAAAMLSNSRYKMTYLLNMKAKSIRTIERCNQEIKTTKWLMDIIDPIDVQKICQDPWYLVEWEDKLKDLGIIKDNNETFTLKQCDTIGMRLNLGNNTQSRLVRYCVFTLNEMCHKSGSTITYFDQFVKSAADDINCSDMNVSQNSKIRVESLREMILHRNDHFFVGRTELHSTKLFVSLRKMWDAQNKVINYIYNLTTPMNTPYYNERELLVNLYRKKKPVCLAGFDIIRNVISKMLWYNPVVDLYVEEFKDIHNISTIDDIQRKAIHTSFNEHFSIVSGGPGRGKSSTVLKAILYVYDKIYDIPALSPLTNEYYFMNDGKTQYEENEFSDIISQHHFVHILSPTGKAVSRVKEVLFPDYLYSKYQPMTIHRLFSKINRLKFLRKAPTTLVIDEVSMVSDMLFYSLLKNFHNLKNVILLGDYDQLPSVQPGNLLRELIESRCVPVTRLIVNYRQGQGSSLPDIADKIIGRENKGNGVKRVYGGWDHILNVSIPKEKPDIEGTIESLKGNNDCVLKLYYNDAKQESIYDDIRKCVENIKENGVDVMNDCVVLVAKRAEVAELNVYLQKSFLNVNVNSIANAFHKDFGVVKGPSHTYEGVKYTYMKGDRVIYLENNYEMDVFNGDIGYVVDMEDARGNYSLSAKFESSALSKEIEMDDCQPAYALTTHKSQGSEFKYVIIYIGKDAQLLHVDQWLYTAFTRAKQKVYIYGYENEVCNTIMRELPYRRTFLKNRMQIKYSNKLKDLYKDEMQNVPK